MGKIITLDVTPVPGADVGLVEDQVIDASDIPSLIIWQLKKNTLNATLTGHAWDRNNKPRHAFGPFTLAPGGQWACMIDYHTDKKKTGGRWNYQIFVQCDDKGDWPGKPTGSNNPNIKNK